MYIPQVGWTESVELFFFFDGQKTTYQWANNGHFCCVELLLQIWVLLHSSNKTVARLSTFKYYFVHTNGVMWILTSTFLEVWSWKRFVTSPSVESERSRISLWLFLELEAAFFTDLMPLWWSGRLESVVMRTSVMLVLTRRTRARGRGCEMERFVWLENALSKHVFCSQITSKWKAIQLILVISSAVLC